jgi:hypothetical protein
LAKLAALEKTPVARSQAMTSPIILAKRWWLKHIAAPLGTTQESPKTEKVLPREVILR